MLLFAHYTYLHSKARKMKLNLACLGTKSMIMFPIERDGEWSLKEAKTAQFTWQWLNVTEQNTCLFLLGCTVETLAIPFTNKSWIPSPGAY